MLKVVIPHDPDDQGHNYDPRSQQRKTNKAPRKRLRRQQRLPLGFQVKWLALAAERLPGIVYGSR